MLKERDSYGRFTCLKPNLAPTVQLAYLLGAIMGDGYTHFWNKGNGDNAAIVLRVKSLRFSKKFANYMQMIGLRPKLFREKDYTKAGRKSFFTVLTYSKEFVMWYKQLTLNKVRNFLLDINLKKAFIEGFWDAEGNWHKPKKKKKCIMIQIGNSNLKLLGFIQQILLELGYRTSKYIKSPNKWHKRIFGSLFLKGGYGVSLKFLKDFGEKETLRRK